MSAPIQTPTQFEEVLAAGKWAWPGGYPQYFVMGDGEAMSFEAAQWNRQRIVDEMTGCAMGCGYDVGWTIVGVEVNWEDSQLRCCQNDELIESAYGDADAMFGGSAPTATQGVFETVP
jgi:hypothetical protein